MRKQSIALTLWLTLPFGALAILMAWIFTSLDKERLMADAPPVGAGAGDTGNANALGQLLAGRDPDAVDRALSARREGRPIDPADWPGGVRITIPAAALGDTPQAPMIAAYDPESGSIITQQLYTADGSTYAATLNTDDITARELYASPGPVTINAGVVRGPNARELYVLVLDPAVPDPALQVSDPMTIAFEINSVFVD